MSDNPTFVASRRVLTPQELNCIVEATQFQIETRRILGRVQQEAAEARDAARQEGYDEGYAEGVRSAMEDMAEAVQNVRAALLSAENDLAAIVLTAIEKMIGSLEPHDLARRAVIRALKDATDAVWVSIHVAPEDHPSIARDTAELSNAAGGASIRSIQSDPLLKPGEMLIETPKGRIHVGLRQQMARLQSGMGRVAT